jgi:hypothetical protein
MERCIESLFLEEFHYCDYYRHCRQIPCSDPKTTFQKNHDFKLSLSQDKRFHYLVQYRNPLQAIASWYIAEHKHRHKNRIGEGRLKRRVKLSLIQDSYAFWRIFLEKNLIYWRRFIDKWVLSDSLYQVYSVSYDDLLEDPEQVLTRVSMFINHDIPQDMNLIEKVVQEQKIAKKHHIVDFKYFDPKLFSRIEDSLDAYFRVLPLDRIT